MVAMIRISLLMATAHTCPYTEAEAERRDLARDEINRVDSGDTQRDIDNNKYDADKLESHLIDYFVNKNHDNQVNAINGLEYLLKAKLPQADTPDWEAVVEAWSAAGAAALAAAVPAAAGIPVAVAILQAGHLQTVESAKQLKIQQESRDITLEDSLHEWRDAADGVKEKWENVVHRSRLELVNGGSANLAEVTRIAWEAIWRLPGKQDWFNSYYATIMESLHRHSTDIWNWKSNANYFVMEMQNGQPRFQGVIFTPQFPDGDACKIVKEVLVTQNHGCWSPKAPGLKGFENPQPVKVNDKVIQPPVIEDSTRANKVGDFQVLLSTGNPPPAEMIDCKRDRCDGGGEDHVYMLYDCRGIRKLGAKIVDQPKACVRWGKVGPPGHDHQGNPCGAYLKGDAKQNVLDALTDPKGAIEFCKTYMEPKSADDLRSKYTVAAVNWNDQEVAGVPGSWALCKQCVGTTMLGALQENQCVTAGQPLEIHSTTNDPCQAIPEPPSGTWCSYNEWGSVEYCWGWCVGPGNKCWGGYDNVASCRTSKSCFFGTAPLCKRRKDWRDFKSLALDAPALPAPSSTNSSKARSACSDEPVVDDCSFSFEPYVQCSDSGDECWLAAAEVYGNGSVWSASGDSIWVGFSLGGVEPGCVAPPDGVEDACAVQIYEGPSCSADLGSKLTAVADAADPYSKHLYLPVKFDTVGNIQFQISSSTAAGRVIVAHNLAGEPVACAEMPPGCFSATTETTTTTTTSQRPPSDPRCRVCETMCNLCRDCVDSQAGECARCWRCWDYDDDEKEDEDDECHALSKDHDWDDDEVQCLSETGPDCRLCWPSLEPIAFVV